MVKAADIQEAYGLLKGIAHQTPLIHSRTLDEMAGGRLYLKMESFQRSGAFKFRGAFHTLSRNLDEARARGVVTGSSGNHGGALAMAAKILGVRAVVVMPEDAAAVKVEAVKALGATVEFCGRSSAERLARAAELVESEGLWFVPPYDHAHIIAGQGTCALEVTDELPEFDVFATPCGGGGLLSGCAAWLSARAPAVQVFGVETSPANDTWLSMQAGERVRINTPHTIADGMRNVVPGELTFPIVQKCVREIVLVEDEDLLSTMRLLMLRAKVVVEPTGAAAVAAFLTGKIKLDGRVGVAVVSGGNVDPEMAERALSAREGVA